MSKSRKYIGHKGVLIYLPEPFIKKLDEWATCLHLTRTELVRRMLQRDARNLYDIDIKAHQKQAENEWRNYIIAPPMTIVR